MQTEVVKAEGGRLEIVCFVKDFSLRVVESNGRAVNRGLTSLGLCFRKTTLAASCRINQRGIFRITLSASWLETALIYTCCLGILPGLALVLGFLFFN